MNRILAIALLIGGTTTAFSASLSIQPPSATFQVGSLVTLDVVADAPDLYIYQFDVQYPSFLAFTNITAQGLFATAGVGVAFDASAPGLISIVNDSLTAPGFIGPEALLSIGFLVTGVGTGTVGIDPSSVILLDSNFADIVPEISSAEVTAMVPEPSTAWLLAFGAALVAIGRIRKRAA